MHPESSTATRFRTDIEGLRAIAVFAVVLYHAGVPQFEGGYIGVDVFFVVSGFLITGILMREVETTGSIRLLSFYAKRARRLLPASFTVLAFVSTVLFIAPRWIPGLIAPQLYGRAISWDIQRASTYVVNWLFAERAVDYHGGTELASPVQHFWSLSVEEQFYFGWPIVLLVVGTATRRSRRTLALVVGGITAASLGASIVMTAANPEAAYFVTTTRIWELSLGGFVSIWVSSPWMRAWLEGASSQALLTGQLIGLMAIGASTLMFDASTAFPGYAALVPTLGTAVLLIAGTPGHAATTRLGELLGSRPPAWIGARSYSIYLWHWPTLWLAHAVWGSLSVAQGLLAVTASIIPALLSFHLVERPFRSAPLLVGRPIRSLAFAGATTIAGFALGALLLATTTNVDRPTAVANESGSVSLTEVAGVQLYADDLQPPVALARYDLPQGYDDGCFADGVNVAYRECSFGDVGSATTVVLIGNSHAGHWSPPLISIAEREGWHLVTIIRSGCRLPAQLTNEGCASWAAEVYERLSQMQERGDIAAILTTTSPLREVSESEATARSIYTDAYRRLAAIGAPVLMIPPTPIGWVIGVDCPSLLVGDLSDCAMPRNQAVLDTHRPPVDAATTAGFTIVDMTPYLCTERLCPAVIENLVVRRDAHHLTRTFALALTDSLHAELQEASPALFEGPTPLENVS